MCSTSLIQRVNRKIKASHWVYLLLHLLLLVIGLLLVMLGTTIFIAIGGSLIAAACAGWVLFLHVWLAQGELHRIEIIRRFGLSEAFEHRSVRIKEQYDVRLNRVHEAIDVMGFGLRALREDYQEHFSSWAARARVRILLLDPEFPTTKCPYAHQRDKEEKNEIGAIAGDVRSFIRVCSNLLKDQKSRFEIRLYRCLPSVNLFRIDDSLFWGPYLIGDVSRNFPTFLLEQHGILYKRFLDHFNEIWSNNNFSRPVPNVWFDIDAPKSDS
jgi:hypothetical protein